MTIFYLKILKIISIIILLGRQAALDVRDHPAVVNLNQDPEVGAKEVESVLQVVVGDLAVAARTDVVVVIRSLAKDPSHVIVTIDQAGIDQSTFVKQVIFVNI